MLRPPFESTEIDTDDRLTLPDAKGQLVLLAVTKL